MGTGKPCGVQVLLTLLSFILTVNSSHDKKDEIFMNIKENIPNHLCENFFRNLEVSLIYIHNWDILKKINPFKGRKSIKVSFLCFDCYLATC